MQGSHDSSLVKYGSTWIAVAKTKEALGSIEEDYEHWANEPDRQPRDHWDKLKRDDAVGLWTDDFSPIIPALKGEWRFWSSEK